MTEEVKEAGEAKVYEVGYLIVPAIPEEKLAEEVLALKGIVEKNGGAIISDDFPRRRVLAYEMSKKLEGRTQKFKEAYFGWVKFEVSKDALPAIKKAVEATPAILRFILINTVRENTLYFPKVSAVKKEDGTSAAPEVADKQATPEEIDKSIDALVIQ